MNAALKWWIQTAIIVFSAFMINQYGWWEFLYNADMTKISFVIIGVFLISSLSIGFISLKSTNWDHIDRLTNYDWYCCWLPYHVEYSVHWFRCK